jgi:hypothetical protein
LLADSNGAGRPTTKRERVLASIRRQPFDAIPWQFNLTSAVRAKLRDHYGTDDLLAATDHHVDRLVMGRNQPRTP